MGSQYPEIQEAVSQILGRVEKACQRAGRHSREVELMAVTKTVEVDRIRVALQAGIRLVGENRVQEAEGKKAALDREFPDLKWHLIGNLQSNKARKALALFDVIETIDDVGLAGKLDRIAAETGRILPVMIEVNLGDEDSKAGVPETAALKLIESCSSMTNLKPLGLMAVPPFMDNPEEVRPFFRRLRLLRDEAIRAGAAGPGFSDLSMGMSNDFEVAIEEGATIVRVGSAMFGERNYSRTA